MSYPDVVKSTSGQGPQKVVVNVTQRSQPSSAALIENEAGIKKGHVNTIASLFVPKQSAPAAKRVPSSRGRRTARPSNEPSLSVHAPNWSVTQTGVETSPKTPPGGQPVPWPQSTGQLKQTKSFGKSDSDIFSSSTRLDSNDAPPAANKPTIVFNKTKYVPRLTQSADRSGQADQQKTQGSDIPNPVRVGRWTVYETLPIKNGGTGASRSQNEVKQRELEAKRKREAEEDEWKRREAQERERIADAERRKADYDRRQREELESQERRRREKQAADEERKRRELLERERKEQEEKRVREETERRKEQEQRRREQLARDRVEQDERRQREEAQRQEELKHRERLEQQMEEEKRRREEAERLMRQERLRREQLEREREEERRRQETERRMHEEYERKQREAQEDQRRWERRMKEEETQRRMAEERKMRDSSQDVYRAKEWTVLESAPSTSAEIPGIVPTQAKQDQNAPSYLRGASTAVKETEYDRCLRQLEEARRNHSKEDEAERPRSRDAERQRDEGMRRNEEQKRRDEESKFRQLEEERRRKEEEERARQPDGKHRGDEGTRFRQGVEQWSALADAEDLGQSNSAVGYRRFLDNDNQGTDKGNGQEAGNRQATDNNPRDREMEQERLRREDERRRREFEEDKRRREARESEENRRRREIEERENSRRRLEEEQRQREEEYRRRADEDERRRRRLEDDRKRREEEFQRASQQRWRSFQDDSDAFSRAEGPVSESAPANDSTASYADATNRSPSQDSSTGYRRLIEDSAEQQPKSDTANRYYERKFSRKYVPSNSNGQGHVLTRKLTSGSNEAPTRFEEWTEYHSAPPPRQRASGGSMGDIRHKERQPTSPSTEDAPTFEEWTVFHKAPTAQSKPHAYDTTDDSRAPPSKDGNSSRMRRFKSTESLSLLGGSGEFQPVEEIMPRRCDTGKRKKDAMIAAALRQLEAGPPPASLDDADAVAARVSPYHSYHRIHSRGGPYQQQQQQLQQQQGGGVPADNGNVFQDSFAVTRDNPAFYWHE